MRTRIGTQWIAALGLFFILTACAVSVRADTSAIVRYVIDGDTIILSNGEKVRYRGINAPEVPHDGAPGEPFGIEATRFNRELVQGKMIRLVQDRELRDRFGRLLAYVYLADGTSVNELLVRKGLAFICFLEKGNPYRKRLLSAQRKAIDEELGIWSVPPRKPEPYYIGNRNSLIFHRPDCPFGRKTGKKNRIRFHSYAEAYRAGYCRCKKCNP